MKFIKSLAAAFTPAPAIDASEVQRRIQSGAAVLIDVREPDEWRGGVVEGAVLLPWSDLKGPRTLWADFLATNAGKELLLYCASGGRSGMAAGRLANEGFKAANAGGFNDLVARGWRAVSPP
jgi:rhodanese-related sulfurtransferase